MSSGEASSPWPAEVVSTVSGLMDSFACAVSIALQHGVPLKLLCEKFAHTRFEPSGWSKMPDIGYAKSIMDYIFRWLQMRFLTGQQQMLFDNLRPRSLVAQSPAAAITEISKIAGSRVPPPIATWKSHSLLSMRPTPWRKSWTWATRQPAVSAARS